MVIIFNNNQYYHFKKFLVNLNTVSDEIKVLNNYSNK